MPRPSRFNPTFGERLRQSRVARGQEPEPTIRELAAPAPREPNLYESLSAVMASYVSPHRRSIFEQAWAMPVEGSGLYLYRQLAEQMRRQVMQEAHEARVQGNRIHLIAHDEMLLNPRSITAPEQPPLNNRPRRKWICRTQPNKR